MLVVDEKTCKKCGTKKPTSEFVIRLTGAKAGSLVAHCKTCNIAMQQIRKERDPSIYRRVEWPSKLRNKYGIEPEDYFRMLEEQGFACATCGSKTPGSRHYKRMGKTEFFYVDHSHATGKVRGLLCSACNRAIGYLRDDPEVCDKVSAYLRRGENFE